MYMRIMCVCMRVCMWMNDVRICELCAYECVCMCVCMFCMADTFRILHILNAHTIY